MRNVSEQTKANPRGEPLKDLWREEAAKSSPLSLSPDVFPETNACDKTEQSEWLVPLVHDM